MIDRITPTRRPAAKARGLQRWRSLLFLHWAVPVDALRPLVPSSLELDLLDGVAYVGVVPFAMEGVRPRLVPAALGFDFLETNVRTYVHHRGRPGVFFLSLEAASAIAVWAARRFWGLPYHHAEMKLERDGDEIAYATHRRRQEARHEVRYRIGESLGPSRPESREFFLLERYLLFVEHRGMLSTGQVYHTPYPVQRAEVIEVRDSLLPAAGLAPCDGPPVFCHYSPGVDVEVFGLLPGGDAR